MKDRRWSLFAVVMALALAMAVAACGDDDDDDGGGGGGGGGDSAASGKIALLLPETKTARYETHDKPDFERKDEGAVSRLRNPLLERRPGRGASSSSRPRRRSRRAPR